MSEQTQQVQHAVTLTPEEWAAYNEEPQGSMIASFLPIILIVVIFYFLLIRPQAKQMKQHNLMLEELKKGDNVITSGGIIAKITKVSKDEPHIMAEISKGVEVKLAKETVKGLVENK